MDLCKCLRRKVGSAEAVLQKPWLPANRLALARAPPPPHRWDGWTGACLRIVPRTRDASQVPILARYSTFSPRSFRVSTTTAVNEIEHVRRFLVQLHARFPTAARTSYVPRYRTSAKRVALAAAKCTLPRCAAHGQNVTDTLRIEQGTAEHANAVQPLQALFEDQDDVNAPPEPTLSRRARSYSDFYDIVKAELSSHGTKKKRKRRRSGRSWEALAVPESAATGLPAEEESHDDSLGKELLRASQQEFLYVGAPYSLLRGGVLTRVGGFTTTN